MTYPMQLFKSPGPYGLGKRTWSVVGAADEDEEAAQIERGYFHTVEEALREKPKRPQLDHDGDGDEGGSLAQDPPALTGKNKAALLQIAADEGVVLAEGASNKEIVAAIRAKRAEPAEEVEEEAAPDEPEDFEDEAPAE